MSRVEEYFAGEQAMGPLAQEIYQAHEKFSHYYIEGAAFHAEDQLNILKDLVVKAKQRLIEQRIDSSIWSDSATLWDQLVASSEDDFATLVILGKAFQVQSYGFLQMTKLIPLCKDPAKRLQLDCEGLRVLTRIKPDQVFAMDDTMLRFYEYQFDKIKQGTLVGGGQ